MYCSLCKTKLSKPIDNHFYICPNCGAYVRDKKLYLTPQKEKERYEKHNYDLADEGYLLFASPLINKILEHYKPHHLGLDFGCGSVSIISNVLQEKSYNTKLYDPFFFPDISYLNFKYDFIFSCEVFEHFYNPYAEIENLLKILKPNGRLFIMTHLYTGKTPFESWYYRRDATHVFIYTQKTMKYIESIFPLSIEHISERLIVFKKDLETNS